MSQIESQIIISAFNKAILVAQVLSISGNDPNRGLGGGLQSHQKAKYDGDT
jgi:hypothetical protein